MSLQIALYRDVSVLAKKEYKDPATGRVESRSLTIAWLGGQQNVYDDAIYDAAEEGDTVTIEAGARVGKDGRVYLDKPKLISGGSGTVRTDDSGSSAADSSATGRRRRAAAG